MTDDEFALLTDGMKEYQIDLVIELVKQGRTSIDVKEVMRAHMLAWGGRPIYHAVQVYQINERNTEMMREFNGRNIGDLCVKYRITRQRFYQILRVYKRKKLAKKGK